MNAMPQVAGMTVYCTDCTDPGLYVSNGSSYAAVGGSGGGAASVAADCDTNGFTGSMIGGVALSGASFSVTITNNSFGDVTLAFQNSDVALSGTAVGSVAVSSTSPASSTLSAGQSALVTYNLTGTPTAGTLQADWTKISLNCTKSRAVANGDATFTNAKNNKYIFSVNDAGLPLNNQGTFISGTTLNIPYTSGQGSYGAYTSPEAAIDAQYAEDGASDWTFSYSYSAGSFSGSGDIVATLVTKKAGVDTDFPAKRVSDITTINFDFVNLPLIIDGVTKPNTVGLDEGGDAIRGALSTNGAAYDAANVDEAILITQAEYNNLMNIVPGATHYGGTTTAMMGTGSGSSHHIFPTAVNSASHGAMPTGSYVCGIWAKAGSTEAAGDKMDFADASSIICSNITWKAGHAGTGANTNNYYAVKRPTTPNPLGPAALIVGNSFGNNIISAGGTVGYYGNNSTCGSGSISSRGYTGVSVQITTSTQKSW